MQIALLIDFGSTYTKVAAVDLDEVRFLGRAQAPSTVDTDVAQGLNRAVRLLQSNFGLRDDDITLKLASSSAAGGLRMAAVGHIGRLTAEAATRAALGAGAKVVGVFERSLTSRFVVELEAISPDIILLAGGVDQGNDDVIIFNARQIAASKLRVPVVVAGNIAARDRVCEILERAGQPTYASSNVMPKINELDVEPAREMIRDVFIRHIVGAKGLDQAEGYVSGGIIMPTPLAVLRMAELLATGAGDEPGMGDTIAMDVGGATTDVHSASWGRPVDMPLAGLEEPFAKRTVEGDLGLRVSAMSLLEVARRTQLPTHMADGLDSNEAWLRADYLSSHTDALPHTAAEWGMDVTMGSVAAYLAMTRHSGRLEFVSSREGTEPVQVGKDLRPVKTLVGTGGVFAFGARPEAILSSCLFDPLDRFTLRPMNPQLYVDSDYIMYAGGLLATVHPEKALRIVKNSLRAVDIQQASTP
jgi:uncharacterized protein (TIGR01319 family)